TYYRIILHCSVIFLLLLFFNCKKETKEVDILLKSDDKINAVEVKNLYGYAVVNVNRLRLRADCDLHSKTLRYLDKGTILRILEKKENRFKIDEMEDYWYNVEIDGIKGFVFGYFIDIYTDYDNANYTSRKYLDFNFQEKTTQDSVSYEDFINNNLFFLSTGKIIQIVDYKKNRARILSTENKLVVTNYFFSKEPNIIYYIAKSLKNIESNGELFKYNLKDDTNTLIVKDIYTGNINIDENIFLSVKLKKIKSIEYWVIESINLTDGSEKELIKLEIKNKIENLDTDILSNTLRRELGTLAHIEFDDKKKFICFKPPEENQTYLISVLDSTYIKIDIEKSNIFNLDGAKFLQIYSFSDSVSGVVYSLVLKDKFSSFEKEIIRSKFYPTNVNVSPRLGYAAVSMVSTDQIKENYYSGSIYLLSLSTYAFSPVSTDGFSYQPKWSYKLIK
ncbi:MAG TPA: SH3 domain-containing protein, partial [Spirochaetota bacterium]|nr:SH3 domain-containing protein [Spirochaetota bacterium]